MAIHPLSYRAASLSDVDCVTLRLCAGDEVDNRGRLAEVVSSDRNAPIGAVRECRDSVHTLARLAVDQQAERVPVVYCAEPRRWPWHPSAVNSNVIVSVSILPVSIPTLLVFPLRMHQSDLFISSTSPLTSFTVPGTGALMPQYRYVTPPPSPCACVNPIPSLLLLPHYLFYHAWHRGTDVSLSRYRYVTPSLPTLFSVLLRKPVRAKRPVQ